MPIDENKNRTPSINKWSFACPHCGVLTSQTWYSCYCGTIEKNNKIILDVEDSIKFGGKDSEGNEIPKQIIDQLRRCCDGDVFLIDSDRFNKYAIRNVNFAVCYNCAQISIWVYDKMVWPEFGEVSPPNSDLPPDIQRDYQEASAILNQSPRGAAALLRLAIQKLCIHLGQKGKNIDDDIGALVKNGLDERVQKALDIVRVIGNEAVHPGQIDMTDDRDMAESLFGLVNMIADIMISKPKHIEEMYGKLPSSKLDGIAKRDGKK